MRVVIDTNIFISGLFWGGVPLQVLRAIIRADALLLLSHPQIIELRDVITRPYFANRKLASGVVLPELLDDIENGAEWVTPVEIPSGVVRDPKDMFLLACAVGGSANYIISGDHHLLEIGQYRGVVMIEPAAFLARLYP